MSNEKEIELDLDELEKWDPFAKTEIHDPFKWPDYMENEVLARRITDDESSDLSEINVLTLNGRYKDLVSRLSTFFSLSSEELSKSARVSLLKQELIRMFKNVNKLRIESLKIGALPLLLTTMCDLSAIVTSRSVHPIENYGLLINAFEAFWEFLTDLPEEEKLEVLKQKVEQDDWANALNAVSLFSHSYVQMISTVFQLEVDRDDDYVSKVLTKIAWELMTTNRQLERSVRWALYFKLKPKLDNGDTKPYLKEVILQCLIVNNRPLLEAYIGENLEDQKFMVQMVDSYINRADYPGTRLKKMRKKPKYTPLEEKFLGEDVPTKRNRMLQNIVTKFLKAWDLPPYWAPNTMYIRAVDFIIFDHILYEKGKMSDNNYEDTIQQICENQPDLQDFLLDYLCHMRHYRQALIWTGLLNIPSERWPIELGLYRDQNPNKLDEVKLYIEYKKDRDEELKKQKYKAFFLKGDSFPVYTIDTRRLLDLAMDEIERTEWKEHEKGAGFIGVDCEWKPVCLTLDEELALIQIATSEAVFLIDVIELDNANIGQDAWKMFFKRIFCNQKITKIGFDFANDLRVMCNTHPWVREIKDAIIDSTICVYNLCMKIVCKEYAKKAVMPDHHIGSKMDLGTICEKILGQEMDKGEQVGNWAFRPLRIEQKLYAAMDSYILLQLYSTINKRLIESVGKEVRAALLLEARIRFEQKVYIAPAQPKIKGEHKAKAIVTNEQFREAIAKVREFLLSENDPEVRPVRGIELCTDNMLNNVGKVLRKCGISTKLVADRTELIKYCAEHKKCEILSMGRAIAKLQPLFPERLHEVVCNLQNESPLVQVDWVLRKLKIVVRDEDLFTRCLKCDSKSFLKVPMPVIKYMFIKKSKALNLDFIDYTNDDVLQAYDELRACNPAVYDGLKCSLFWNNDYTNEFDMEVVRLNDGSIELIENMIIADNDGAFPIPVEVNLSDFSMSRLFNYPGTIFDVCYSCGKVNYRGDYPENAKIDREVQYAEDLSDIPSTSQDSIMDNCRILSTVSAADYFNLKMNWSNTCQ